MHPLQVNRRMKKLLLLAAAMLGCVLHAAPVSFADSGKNVRTIQPSLAECSEYWHQATTVIDVQAAVPTTHLVCGRVPTFGRYCILCVRAERAGKVVAEAYFYSEEWGDPKLSEAEGKVRIVMPSGFVLFEAFR